MLVISKSYCGFHYWICHDQDFSTFIFQYLDRNERAYFAYRYHENQIDSKPHFGPLYKVNFMTATSFGPLLSCFVRLLDLTSLSTRDIKIAVPRRPLGALREIFFLRVNLKSEPSLEIQIYIYSKIEKRTEEVDTQPKLFILVINCPIGLKSNSQLNVNGMLGVYYRNTKPRLSGKLPVCQLVTQRWHAKQNSLLNKSDRCKSPEQQSCKGD